ncbi:MAG: hypothetical protein Q8O61_15045, partial [Nocardioides sp.]|nr:hypothetical protein [Nocardioides sp.]
MRRRSTHSRALLLVATLVTAGAVGIGIVSAPSATVDVRVIDAGARSVVHNADVTARPVSVSRGGLGAGTSAPTAKTLTAKSGKARSGKTSLVRIPPYKVVKAPPTIEKLPPGPVPGDPFSFRLGTLNIL